MVRDVLMKVGQDQKQFEHTLALIGIGLFGALLEIVDDQQGVGKQPLEGFWIDGMASTAALQRLIGTNERLVQEVVETELFGG